MKRLLFFFLSLLLFSCSSRRSAPMEESGAMTETERQEKYSLSSSILRLRHEVKKLKQSILKITSSKKKAKKKKKALNQKVEGRLKKIELKQARLLAIQLKEQQELLEKQQEIQKNRILDSLRLKPFARKKQATIQSTHEWLEGGGSPNATLSEDGKTLLMAAAEVESPALTKRLLEAGSDPKARTQKHGEMALHVASRQGSVEVLELLLPVSGGPNVETEEGRSPLELVIHFYGLADPGEERERRVEVFKALLAAKASTAHRSPEGYTPLMLAASANNISFIIELLGAGALVDEALESSVTALYLAALTARSPYAVELLLEGGASPEVVVNGVSLYSLVFELARSFKEGDIEREILEEILSHLKSHGADHKKRVTATLSLMNRLGYPISEGGVCYGLAFMGAQAFMRGGGAQFEKRLERIREKGYEEVVASLLQKRDEADDSAPFTEVELDLLGFFDGVSVFYGGEVDIPYHSKAQNWKKALALFEGEEEGFDHGELFVMGGVVHRGGVKALLEWALEAKAPFAVGLQNIGHQVALLKDERGLFFLNHDRMVAVPEVSEAIVGEVKKAIALSPGVFFAEFVMRPSEFSLPLLHAKSFLLYREEDFASPAFTQLTSESQTRLLEYALFYASRAGHLELAKFLLSRGVSPGLESVLSDFSCLMAAVKGGHKDLVIELLQSDADFSQEKAKRVNALSVAFQANELEIALILMGEGFSLPSALPHEKEGLDLFYSAAKAGAVEFAKILLEHYGGRINVNQSCSETGETPLLAAVSANKTRMVRFLAEEVKVRLDVKDKEEAGVFARARKLEDPASMFKVLADVGANPYETILTNFNLEEDSFFLRAVKSQDLQTVKTLLSAGTPFLYDDEDEDKIRAPSEETTSLWIQPFLTASLSDQFEMMKLFFHAKPKLTDSVRSSLSDHIMMAFMEGDLKKSRLIEYLDQRLEPMYEEMIEMTVPDEAEFQELFRQYKEKFSQ